MCEKKNTQNSNEKLPFWRNDDKELADRAMDRAIKLDKKNSAIFYMLFNLRMGREEAALKWFYTYQECDLKGSDQRALLPCVYVRKWLGC